MDEIDRQLRIDILDARDELRTIQSMTQSMPPREILVKTTTKDSYPTIPQAYYACNPCSISGPTVEGSNAVVQPETPTRIVYVWNAGSKVPPVGTVRIATSTGGRWVFAYC